MSERLITESDVEACESCAHEVSTMKYEAMIGDHEDGTACVEFWRDGVPVLSVDTMSREVAEVVVRDILSVLKEF